MTSPMICVSGWPRLRRRGRPDNGPSVQPNGRRLFVACPAGDMEGSWKIVVEELSRRGFDVVPEPTAALARAGAAATGTIRGAVAEAELSIHLLGEGEGFRPAGVDPIVRLQLDLAAARAPTPTARPTPRRSIG